MLACKLMMLLISPMISYMTIVQFKILDNTERRKEETLFPNIITVNF